jgi:hypothetical protein
LKITLEYGMSVLMSLEWLMNNAGPIVRWRTANELLLNITASKKSTLIRELLGTPLVQTWLSRLSLGDFPNPLDTLDARSLSRLGGIVHSGKITCLENVLGKLAEFGLQSGMPGLDERVLPLMRIFALKPDWKTGATFQNAWETLVKSVFAWVYCGWASLPIPRCRIS